MKIRAVFDRFSPYEWEMSPEEIAKVAKIPVGDVIRLDTNTSPFIPEKWLRTLSKDVHKLPVNQYPDTRYTELTRYISRYCGVKDENIIVASGADEAIDIIIKTIVDYDDKVVLSTPSYPMFRIASQIAGGKTINVPRRNSPPFADDVDGIIHTSKENRASAVFLCNPNNPTGTFLEIDQIRRIVEELDCGVVVDEAYFEYCGKTAIKLINEHPNLFIIRTLSKAFSLAGARIAYILANEETANKLNYVRPPNSLSVISIRLGIIALSDVRQVNRWVKYILKERDRCFKALSSMRNVKPYPSVANFILFRLLKGNSEEVYRQLLTKGISIRNLNGVEMLDNCMRVTIGSKKQNNRFLSELKRIVD
ncbi:MAG: histidinol-phosphate transaminase [Nitrososphaeria archaeon]